MRKSNVIVIAILVIASIFFLWLWNYLHFNLVDNPLDLVITILWWVVVIGVCIAIMAVERRRRESVRTAFIGDGAIYNGETGIVPVKEANPSAYVQKLRTMLNDLSYSSRLKDDPTEAHMRFSYIVRSTKFSDEGKVWEGEVVRLGGAKDTHSFHNEQELANLLA